MKNVVRYEIYGNVKVLNDAAEKCIQLIQEYIILIIDKDDKQLILHFVKEYR